MVDLVFTEIGYLVGIFLPTNHDYSVNSRYMKIKGHAITPLTFYCIFTKNQVLNQKIVPKSANLSDGRFTKQ